MPSSRNEDPSVTAVVVTYNRIELLTKVLAAVKGQVPPPEHVIVVDNGSTDGTRQMLLDEHGDLSLIFPQHNLGGAGGFARGMAWALEIGSEFVWVMDDDAVPDQGCLMSLYEAHRACPELTMAAPKVLDGEGHIGPRNYPWIDITDIRRLYQETDARRLPVRGASFVGPMFRATAMTQTHMPISDFFIWHDDMEYTFRLGQYGPQVLCLDATIRHLAVNAGPEAYFAERNLFNVRNNLWRLRLLESRDNRTRLRILAYSLRVLRAQYRNAPKKSQFMRVVVTGIFQGLRRMPRQQAVEQVIQESTTSDMVHLQD